MAIRIPIITTFDKKGVNNALRNIDGLARQAGKAAGVLAGGVAVGIGASVREFANFDEALNKSLAIMGDVSDTMRGEMSDAAREVAKTTTFSAEQAAESFFFLASAGLSAEQSVDALPQVAAFAQAGMFDMATATDLATDAQSALGLASDDAKENLDNLTRVTDVFVKANTLANTSTEQLATALTTKAGNALKTVGKEIEEGAAALAVFADQGIKGERAGTLLTNTIFGLTDRAKAAPEEFEKLGLSIFDSDENMRSFTDISEQFTEVLGGMTKEQQIATIANLGFTKQSREGLLALVGQSEALTEYEQGLRNAGGTAQEVANNQLDTFNAKLSLLGSAVTDVALEIGSGMAPKIEELIAVVEQLLPKIGDQLIEILDQIDFEQVFTGISNFLNFVADNLHLLDELIVGLATLAAGLTGFTTAVRIATVATTAFGLSIRALPFIGLIAAAVSALSVALGALALSNQNATKSQDEFNDEITETSQRIETYKEAQDNGTVSANLFARQIDQLEKKLRELRAAQQEANNFTEAAKDASFAARDAAIAHRLASEGLIPALDKSADGYLGIAEEAANAQLGVSQLALTEQARAIQAEEIARIQLYGGQASEARDFQEILNALTARTQFQTGAFHENQEEIKRVGAAMGLVVPGLDSGTSSLDALASGTGKASEGFDELTKAIAKTTEAQNAFSRATPGSPGPGGMFEAVFPDGSTRLVDIEGNESRGLSTGGQQLGRGVEDSGIPSDPFGASTLSKEEQDFIKNAFPEVELGMGGIVMKPTRALIGEAGPEAVVPLDRAGGFGKTQNTININVTTGVGTDPVATGRAVVDAIKRYEATNGKVFVTA